MGWCGVCRDVTQVHGPAGGPLGLACLLRVGTLRSIDPLPWLMAGLAD